MCASDLDRVKADLAVIRRAGGIELPFGRDDVRASLALGGGGLVAIAWALVPHGFPAQWGMVPLIVLVVGYMVRMRYRYRRDAGRSSIRRREYRGSLVGMVLVGGLAVVYRLWATDLGLSLPVAGGAAFFIFGVSLILPALRDRTRIPELGIAVPLILAGLVIPLWPANVWVPVGAAFAVGGFAMALLGGRQVRGSVIADDAD